MLPLQMGLPGGPELLVVLLIMLLLFGLPAVLVVFLLARRGAGDERVEELERRVEELEEEVREERSG